MRYARIDECEVVNGKECGISVYIQGCPHPHCPGCFNPESWDFDGGKEWTPEIESKLMQLIDRPYIKRISILGGEPLADKNVQNVYDLVNKIRILFPSKTIWLYSRYTWNSIIYPVINDDFFAHQKRKQILSLVDILVDGRFEIEHKDLTLAFRGSTNQRIIDTKKSLEKGEVVLWNC